MTLAVFAADALALAREAEAVLGRPLSCDSLQEALSQVEQTVDAPHPPALRALSNSITLHT